jgi:hypothetical protein
MKSDPTPKSKTTHQIAQELLALPDVELVIEGWCQMEGYTMTAAMTNYDPEGTAILWQKTDSLPHSQL